MTQKETLIGALEYAGIDFHHSSCTLNESNKKIFVVGLKAKCITKDDQELELYFTEDGQYIDLELEA
jgi:hypothetical protein